MKTINQLINHGPLLLRVISRILFGEKKIVAKQVQELPSVTQLSDGSKKAMRWRTTPFIDIRNV